MEGVEQVHQIQIEILLEPDDITFGTM